MRVKITITGKVHDVGYRVFLLNQADSLLIERFDARNVYVNGKQALIVLVEGDEEQIREFIEFVKTNKPEKAIVEEIKVEEYDRPIRSIDSYRSSIMIDQLNKIVQVGLTMIDKMGVMLEKQDAMLQKQDEMLQKQDRMLEKQDETVKVIREENEKTREHLGEKIDTVSEKLDRVAEKIDLLRSDLKSYMEERFARIEREIERIKAKIGLD